MSRQKIVGTEKSNKNSSLTKKEREIEKRNKKAKRLLLNSIKFLALGEYSLNEKLKAIIFSQSVCACGSEINK